MTLSYSQLFTGWESDELQDLARIMNAAAGEGEHSPELADALRQVAEHREIELPSAYGLGMNGPARWRKELDR